MPTDENSTIVGVFANRNSAQQAVQELQNAGFRDAHIREEEAQTTHTLVMLATTDRQQEARAILNRYGASDQAAQTPSTEDDEASGTHLEYDPITGPKQVSNVPVAPASYGMQRDPSVETDAQAKTYDTNVRSDTTLDDGSSDTSFERPLEPGTTSPGSPDDPNDHLPFER